MNRGLGSLNLSSGLLIKRNRNIQTIRRYISLLRWKDVAIALLVLNYFPTINFSRG
ncbi:hypothetical protein [Scytonema sp. NUACC26]|uniref:hypothetical protein n=1 Tax=Scytonema sp. NUACC26 TaxID=3140176 RepID=UPI0038B38C4A